MNKPSILIVEDDKTVARLIATMMETQGYLYHTAYNGNEGIAMAFSHKPDVMLLDLGLPDIDGVEIIKRVRECSNMPIIVVSSREDDRDKVKALDEGADDYITKPFSIDELLARVRVALRRVHNSQEYVDADSSVYENGALKIDYLAGCAYINDSEIHLTPIEYRLLCLLAKNTGRVLTHNYILKEVWGSINASDIPSLRVFMTGLRKKLREEGIEEDMIQTHIGVGYRMLKF